MSYEFLELTKLDDTVDEDVLKSILTDAKGDIMLLFKGATISDVVHDVKKFIGRKAPPTWPKNTVFFTQFWYSPKHKMLYFEYEFHYDLAPSFMRLEISYPGTKMITMDDNVKIKKIDSFPSTDKIDLLKVYPALKKKWK